MAAGTAATEFGADSGAAALIVNPVNTRLVRQPPFEILLVNRGGRETATA